MGTRIDNKKEVTTLSNMKCALCENEIRERKYIDAGSVTVFAETFHAHYYHSSTNAG